MKAIIIGAKGQLGTDLLKTRPAEVEAVALDIEELDITDSDAVTAALREEQPDAVINAAAYVRVDDAEREVTQAFNVNALGAKNMAEGCRDVGAVLLQVSTDYVFGGGKTSGPYTEEDTPDPVNTYGISKYAGELFVKHYCERHYLVRTASLYGAAGASGKGGNFVYTILGKAAKGDVLRVVDDMYMSPSCTYDVALKIWEILGERYPFGTYHAANAGYCSWYAFARKIIEFSRLTAQVIPVSHTEYVTRARRPLWSPLMSTKAVSLRSWESALQAFISGLPQSRFDGKEQKIS